VTAALDVSYPADTVSEVGRSCAVETAVFVAQAAFAFHLNWTTVGDDQRPTEADSHQQGTQEPLQ